MKRMKSSMAACVAASLDAPVRALPLLPDLFTGLRALGSQPRRIVAWLRAAGIEKGDRVLDLGCGKGAVAVAVADRLGCFVTGVDGLAPFVNDAVHYAARRGVRELCAFHHQPIERWRRGNQTFDAVLVLGVWPVLRAAKLARRLTRPGGVYLIDDAVCVRPVKPNEPYRDVPSPERARRAIESTGDRIERMHVMSKSQSLRSEMVIYNRLQRQAARISRRNPHHRPLLKQYLRRQRDAIAVLNGPVRYALWLMRRTRSNRR